MSSPIYEDRFTLDSPLSFLEVGDFPEHFHLLVLKSLSFLASARHSCPSAKVLVKTDDDVVFDLENMSTENLEEKASTAASCKVDLFSKGKLPKYFIPEAEYDKDVLPEYCSGVFYYMSKKVKSPSMPYHTLHKRLSTLDSFAVSLSTNSEMAAATPLGVMWNFQTQREKKIVQCC